MIGAGATSTLTEMWFAATAPRGIEPMGAGGLRLHMGVCKADTLARD